MPSPLFIGDKETHFFNHITKEIVQRIVGQRILYYSVSEEHTKVHKLYGEAIKKTTFTPVEINALVLFQEVEQTVTEFTVDTQYNIEVYFHYHELEERKIIPRVGDFIKWGKVVYEIGKLTEPQLIFGKINEKEMVKAECKVARKSQFEVLDELETYI